jgi:hypothetical protein
MVPLRASRSAARNAAAHFSRMRGIGQIHDEQLVRCTARRHLELTGSGRRHHLDGRAEIETPAFGCSGETRLNT